MEEAPKRIPLSALETGDADAIQQLGEQLQKFGAALISANGSRYMESVREADETARGFFALDRDAKMAHEMRAGGERDFGYVEVPNVKEHWQMRLGPSDYWPSEEMQRVSEEYYWRAMEVTRTVLRSVGKHLGLEDESLTGLLLDEDDDIRNEGKWSSTIYRYFHYLMRPLEESGNVPPCYVHTDIGLITLVPRSSLPCLQIVHPWSYDWMSIEEYAGPEDVIVLAGEMLQFATAHRIRAVVHRVHRLHGTQDRFSQVFLVRGRKDAMLDPSAMPRLPDQFWDESNEPMSVAEFMKWKYSTRMSANFAKEGQGDPVFNTGVK